MSTGKQVALILGIVGGVFVLAIAACGGFIYWGYRSSEEVASPRIDAFFAAVNKGKSDELYAQETSAQFRAAIPREQFASLCDVYRSRLGPLESKSFESFHRRQHNAESIIEVSYQATFEKASGTIHAQLIDESGQWKFTSIRVDSPVFLDMAASVTCPNCGTVHPADARFCPTCGAATKSPEADEEAKTIPRTTKTP